MILSAAYIFKKNADKSKTRLDCIASTGNYEEFEMLRAVKDIKETAFRNATRKGSLAVYYTAAPNENYGGIDGRKASRYLVKKRNISGIYKPDAELGFAYGDMYGTGDALLFVERSFSETSDGVTAGSEFVVLVAKGKRHDQLALYYELVNGGLDEEIEKLLSQAKSEVQKD